MQVMSKLSLSSSVWQWFLGIVAAKRTRLQLPKLLCAQLTMVNGRMKLSFSNEKIVDKAT